MPAPVRRTTRIFRIPAGIFGALLTVGAALCAARQQPEAIPIPAIEALKLRADSGDAGARLRLTEFLVSADPASPGYDQALAWLWLGAAQNKPDAQFALGYLYEHGKSLPLDFSKAAENYRKAALKGYSPAENNLGGLYRLGNGVPRDMAVAFQWYQRAAQHGNRVAQQNLGTFFYLGYATPVDYAEAAKWFRASAEQSFAEGQSSLAYCYLKGLGVPHDDSEAARWALLAARQGQARAEALLAYLYERGSGGLALDYAEAYAWYSRSIAAGENANAERLKALAQVMTRKQIDEAKSLLSTQSVAVRDGGAASIPLAGALLPNP
ncbi:MAG TPA: tetratricopeptide repeat protein [Candidatus Acidoferrum sp.]|nr:tetratricopeptide repeat protein [Candidatus Acidoferrum sp.]